MRSARSIESVGDFVFLVVQRDARSFLVAVAVQPDSFWFLARQIEDRVRTTSSVDSIDSVGLDRSAGEVLFLLCACGCYLRCSDTVPGLYNGLGDYFLTLQ